MPIDNQKNEEKWLEKAIDQLKSLYQQATELADEDDILPTELEFTASVQILKSFQKAPRPRIGLTINGETSLAWENTGDEFCAFIKQDGSVQYYRDKTSVDEHSFSKYLTAVPA